MNLEQLQSKTAEFFRLHWPTGQLTAEPRWSDPWNFVGTIPNYDDPGVYAIFAEAELLYIGVSEAGIAIRTNRYTRVAPGGRSLPPAERPYVATSDWLPHKPTSIRTLGLPAYPYLAPALESFLVPALKPRVNVLKRA